MANITLRIEGMTCQHCVKGLTEGLSSLEGVRSVYVSLEAGQAAGEYDEKILALEALRAKVAEIGYRAA